MPNASIYFTPNNKHNFLQLSSALIKQLKIDLLYKTINSNHVNNHVNIKNNSLTPCGSVLLSLTFDFQSQKKTVFASWRGEIFELKSTQSFYFDDSGQSKNAIQVSSQWAECVGLKEHSLIEIKTSAIENNELERLQLEPVIFKKKKKKIKYKI